MSAQTEWSALFPTSEGGSEKEKHACVASE